MLLSSTSNRSTSVAPAAQRASTTSWCRRDVALVDADYLYKDLELMHVSSALYAI